jgi:ethanolamine utilization protein EutJ
MLESPHDAEKSGDKSNDREIVANNLPYKVPVLTVGGGAALPGAEDILSDTVGMTVRICPNTLMVTPAGIAARLWREKNRVEETS